MLILPLNTLEICSPSVPWCQQKFQWVSGEMARLSTSFYQLVIPTMEMLLMRSRQCPKTIFLEAEVRKPRAQEASVSCILGRSRRTDISPDFAVPEGLKLILFAFQLPTFWHIKFWSTEHLGLKDKLKVTRIKGKKFFFNSRSCAMATLVYSPFSKLIYFFILSSEAECCAPCLCCSHIYMGGLQPFHLLETAETQAM